MKTTNIANLKEGELISSFLICKRFNIKVSRLGDPFIDLFLEDSSGTIRAKIWSFVDHFMSKISINEAFAVKGKVISFNQSLEIDIHHISKVENKLYDKYGYKKELLIAKVDENTDGLYENLLHYIDEIDHKCKKNIKIFFKKNKKKVISIPSLDKKYNLSGGFLSQIISVLNLNKKLSNAYEYDYNLVKIAIIFKNIGLVDFFNEDFYKIDTEEMVKGYNLFSLDIYDKNFKKYDDIYLLLQNLILKNKFSNQLEIDIVKYFYKIDLLMTKQ